jgi:hypothetical protein
MGIASSWNEPEITGLTPPEKRGNNGVIGFGERRNLRMEDSAETATVKRFDMTNSISFLREL